MIQESGGQPEDGGLRLPTVQQLQAALSAQLAPQGGRVLAIEELPLVPIAQHVAASEQSEERRAAIAAIYHVTIEQAGIEDSTLHCKLYVYRDGQAHPLEWWRVDGPSRHGLLLSQDERVVLPLPLPPQKVKTPGTDVDEQKHLLRLQRTYAAWTVDEVAGACRDVALLRGVPVARVLALLEDGNTYLTKDFLSALPPFEQGGTL